MCRFALYGLVVSSLAACGKTTEVECTSSDECAPGLVCVGGDCRRDNGEADTDAATTDTGDAELDVDPDAVPDVDTSVDADATPDGDGDADAVDTTNDCGGENALSWLDAPAAPGERCGTCGTLACDGLNDLVCTDDEVNACGGCVTLAAAVGDGCGACGTWACGGPDALLCERPDRNACGGCEPLADEPGATCEGCAGAACTFACDGDDALVCAEFPAPDNMVYLPAGTFVMGSPPGELGRDADELAHSVTLTRPFYLDATEVTQGAWGARFPDNPAASATTCGADCPIENVSWYEALSYANALSRAEGLQECYVLYNCVGTEGVDFACDAAEVTVASGSPYDCEGYRLPTEAEWEYAARAGTRTATWVGDLRQQDCEEPSLLSFVWFCGSRPGGTQPVAGLLPNPWGLFDMLGNVWERVWDLAEDYPPSGVVDPYASGFEGNRRTRGGASNSSARNVRAADRAQDDPNFRAEVLGFRLARSVLPACARPQAPCEDELQSNGQFACDVEHGLCRRRCQTSGGRRSCDDGVACIASEFEFFDPDTGDVSDGLCYAPQCQGLLDTDACAGQRPLFSDGVECTSLNCTCTPLQDGLSYCLRAGRLAVGEPCSGALDGEATVADLCDVGLTCYGGSCAAPCDVRAGDADCDGDAGERCADPTRCECVLLPPSGADGAGLCDTPCDAFSVDQCPAGFTCAPTWDNDTLAAWSCIEREDASTLVGEPCSDEVDVWGTCAEGTICTNVDADGAGTCEVLCDSTLDPDGACSPGQRCNRSAIDGLGLCATTCDPWPRTGGAYPGCDGDQYCFPGYDIETAPAPTSYGYCQDSDEADTADVGEPCDQPGFFGGGCADGRLCLDTGSGAPACQALCEPFAPSPACAVGGCNGVLPLTGVLYTSYCSTDFQPGDAFDRCSNEGSPCAGDMTVCLDFGSGAACQPVCRDLPGIDDCAPFPGTSCLTGMLNPDVVPLYMGLCN